MALAPKFAGQRLTLTKTPDKAIHTVELYLDYVCPFSAKMFKTLYKKVIPEAAEKPYANRVQFIFRQMVQPWHPSSSLVHEAGLAVLKLDATKFWDFSERLMEDQKNYFDESVVKESRNETYKRLAKLGASSGVDEGKMYKLLVIPEKAKDDASNVGNDVTDDLKLITKAARLTGVHVTPTVLFNGVVENSISSSFTADQWDEWLRKNCVTATSSAL